MGLDTETLLDAKDLEEVGNTGERPLLKKSGEGGRLIAYDDVSFPFFMSTHPQLRERLLFIDYHVLGVGLVVLEGGRGMGWSPPCVVLSFR